MEGKVLRYNERGFGFIGSEESDDDFFFHFKNFKEKINTDNIIGGMKVQFDVREEEKGSRAINIEVI